MMKIQIQLPRIAAGFMYVAFGLLLTAIADTTAYAQSSLVFNANSSQLLVSNE